MKNEFNLDDHIGTIIDRLINHPELELALKEVVLNDDDFLFRKLVSYTIADVVSESEEIEALEKGELYE